MDNWRAWSDKSIETWVVDHEDTTDESVMFLIEDMEDELDKRNQDRDLIPQWDAREGDRPAWDY